jgi:hypothetical protein
VTHRVSDDETHTINDGVTHRVSDDVTHTINDDAPLPPPSPRCRQTACSRRSDSDDDVTNTINTENVGVVGITSPCVVARPFVTGVQILMT